MAVTVCCCRMTALRRLGASTSLVRGRVAHGPRATVHPVGGVTRKNNNPIASTTLRGPWTWTRRGYAAGGAGGVGTPSRRAVRQPLRWSTRARASVAAPPEEPATSVTTTIPGDDDDGTPAGSTMLFSVEGMRCGGCRYGRPAPPHHIIGVYPYELHLSTSNTSYQYRPHQPRHASSLSSNSFPNLPKPSRQRQPLTWRG
jgi:hypothetical protein